MRKLSLIGGLLCLFAALPAMAELKIIAVRFGEAVQSSPQFKSSQASMKAEFERRKAELEGDAKKLGDDVTKFKKEADVMAPDARAKAEKDLQTRKIDFDYKQQQFGQDFQKRDRELSEKLMGSVHDVILQIAKEKGADLVVQDPLFASDEIDVTDEVIKRLTATGGGAAGGK